MEFWCEDCQAYMTHLPAPWFIAFAPIGTPMDSGDWQPIGYTDPDKPHAFAPRSQLTEHAGEAPTHHD